MDNATTDKNLIDAVLFDFGGVLAEEGWRNGFKAIAAQNGLDGEALAAAATETVYETGYIIGRAAEKIFWETLKKKTGIRGNDDVLRREIYSRFVLRSWMLELAQKIREQNRIVGILSDQIDMLDQLDAQYHFFQQFDHVFNSYHLGKSKRNITIFDDLAGFLKISPGRILFIDDHPGHVERARQKGWQAILYTDQETLRSALKKYLPFLH